MFCIIAENSDKIMEERFIHIATVLFQHEYFEDNSFRSLAIKPTAGTQAIMRNLRMVFKSISGGAHLLISEHYLSSATAQEEPLRFELESLDPHFINYTDLEAFEPATSLLCFDNLNVADVADSPVYLLGNESFQGAREILRVENDTIALVSFQKDSLYTFSRGNDDIIPWDFIEQMDTTINAFKFYDVPEGIIRVYEGDDLFDMFYYKPSGVWDKPLGIVELIPSILLQQYVAHNSTITYVIKFEVRKTHWKYLCIQNREPYLKNLIIKHNTTEDDFHKSIAGDITTFISKRPIALSENRKDSYQLMQKSVVENVEDKTVIATLPYPSPQQLYPPDDTSFKAYFSHIYIYI